MSSSSEELNKLWILSHLLFPNASQSRDFFKILTTEFSKKINLNSTSGFRLDANVYRIVCRLYRQTRIIPSSSSFAAFPESISKSWGNYFLKCTKEEIRIAVGVIYLKLSLSEIANLENKSESEVRLKFNRSILNYFPLPTDTAEALQQLSDESAILKKFNEKKENKFFIRESLVSYVFENATSELSERIEKFINKNRLYLDCVKDIRSFKQNIESLTIADLTSLDMPFEQEKTIQKLKFLKSQAAWGLTSLVVIFFIGILIWRPEFIKRLFSIESTKVLEMQEIKIARPEAENNESTPKEIEVAQVKEASSSQNAKPTNILDQTQSKAEKNVEAVGVKKLEDLKKNKALKESESVSQKKDQGQLYRAVLYVNDIEQVTDLIKDKIISLGGKKAGEVELGWMKNKNVSYYHFSFPQNNQALLESYLNQFGATEFKTEKHPRIMPEGTLRYIMEIKLNE